ncbi:hypothetical protein N0V93_005142 [Gnomoniopsis smithogilvyi]|uniref:BZIP domain-containing protein n=1 Tax=Gnomoniopsis smithogilvyi TaxID=1191159 RepID=A0A9W8YSS4_9PEZI|nr:hypothetical protein N0V93_005142 [Gnomoniopsis smithogilvyi]
MKGKRSPEQSILMDKWPSKTTEQNANRVRNNQRRHRARVKSRIKELEARLEESNTKLEAALSTISSLTAEVESYRASQASTSSSSGNSRPVKDVCLALDLDHQNPRMTNTSAGNSDNTVDELVTTQGPLKPQPGALISDSKTVENDAICNCLDGAPPPAHGESTMSCSSALQIIEQQNFSGVEVTTIKAWLGPGFRLKPGEACRVETNRLYELLDHITSPS